MYNKFLIFIDDNFEPSIVLAKVNYHKDIKYAKELKPIPLTKELLKANGWQINSAQEAFDKGRVYYFDECIKDFGIKKLELD